MDHEHDVNSDPMSIERCREILGREADGLSDLEVEDMRRHADAIAHVVVQIFFEQHTREE